MVFHQFFLGFNQTSVQNVEVVVERTPSFPGQSNPAHAVINGDCNVACIVADLQLNTRLGLDVAPNVDVNIAALDAVAEQLFAEGVGLSPVITRPTELLSQITDLLKLVGGAPVLDPNGLLSLILQRFPAAPIPITIANLVALPKLTPDDWSAVINETYLIYLDRDADYQPDFVLWKDPAAIYAKDRPEPQILNVDAITQKTIAKLLGNIRGQVDALPKCGGTLEIAFSIAMFGALAPGNCISFTYALRPVLNGLYRIISRALPDPAKPVIEVEVIKDYSYLFTNL
jgi:hypothetical protein